MTTFFFCFCFFLFVFFFLFCFLVDEGRKDPNTTISGPTSARQQGPTLNAGLVAL